MGHRMSSALLSRACALAFAFVIGLLALAAMIPIANAMPTPNPIQPAAMTVTVVLDKSSYLSGDTAAAQAIVYRTPAPGNYTYVWRVRNFFFQLLNTTTTAGATFRYPIALDYIGTLRFEATVDDGQGTVAAGQQSATVAQAYMALSLDRGDYNAGDTASPRLTLTARGTASLPSQFRWALSSASASVSSITTGPTADLFLTIPQGTGNGGLLMFANELNTGAGAFQTVQVGSVESFWATQVGGITVFALILGVLFVLLLLMVIALWRKVGAGLGPIGGKAAVPPPPPEGPVPSAPTSPMSITCRRCGKPIDLSTSRRPIAVMCPSCGETQVVT